MILDELAEYLEDSGIGVQAVDLFTGSMPDEPDTILVLYEYPGDSPEYIQDQSSPSTEKPQIQVVARAVLYDTARNLAARAWSALAIVRNADLSGTRYVSVKPNNSPGILRRDTNDRVLIFFNASVEKGVSLVPTS